MERRFLQNDQSAVRVEKRAEGGPGVIAGYGAVFYDGTPATEYVLWDDRWGRAVERILPGAFDGALQRPDDVRGLFNHDASQVLGRTSAGTMKLMRDGRGLQYEITPGDTQAGRDTMEHVRRRDVTGSSFSFTIPNGGEKWTSTKLADGRYDEVRELTAVQLWDVGPVTFPAYDATSAGVRAAGSQDVSELRAARLALHQQEQAAEAGQTADQVRARARMVELDLR